MPWSCNCKRALSHETLEEQGTLQARVREWAVKLDANVATIYVRPRRRKWASCSTTGNLNLNTELLGMDCELGDYVIVHELLHFSVPNHGKLWKSLMLAHLGDHERLARRLRTITNQQ
jgi:predicted metal-dependent hydrolase